MAKTMTFDETVRACDLFGSLPEYDLIEQFKANKRVQRYLEEFATICEDCGEVVFADDVVCDELMFLLEGDECVPWKFDQARNVYSCQVCMGK